MPTPQGGPYWTFASLAERDAQEVHPTEVGRFGRILEGAGGYCVAIKGGKGATCWGPDTIRGYHLVGPVVPLTDAPNIDTDASRGCMFSVTLRGNRRLSNPLNLVSGGKYLWIVRQDAIGGRILTPGSRFRSGGGVFPLTATPQAMDLIEGWSDGTRVYVTAIALDVS